MRSDEALRRLEQEGIARFKPDVPDPGANRGPAAPDGHDRGVEQGPEPRLAHSAPDQRRAGGHDRLHELPLVRVRDDAGLTALWRGQTADSPQRDN